MQKNGIELEIAGKVDEQRLWSRLMELGRIGETDSGGVCRLALSEEEIIARHLLINWARDLNLKIFTDDISNLYFRLEGADESAAPVMSGSHIDSQPNGGKFDGAFGAIAALEALQSIQESGHTPCRSVEAVIWLNEEGSRFAPGMMGSEVFSGRRELQDCLPVRDSNGISVADALEETQSHFQHLPRRSFGFEVANFIEAHIEQGPQLEASNVPVGVVTGIQGSRRFRIRVTGEQAHAGTAPMRTRKDALLAATDIVQEIRSQPLACEQEMKLTFGLFEIYPNAPSVVPSSAYFSVDIRHPDSVLLARLGQRIHEICEFSQTNCQIEVSEIASAESLQFPEGMRRCIEECAQMLDIPSMPIYSLAGHDARQMHYHCQSGMIFTPCEKGISHSDKEYCQSSDLVMGTRVLAAALANLADQPLQ